MRKPSFSCHCIAYCEKQKPMEKESKHIGEEIAYCTKRRRRFEKKLIDRMDRKNVGKTSNPHHFVLEKLEQNLKE